MENILQNRIMLPTIELIDLNGKGFAIIDIEDSEKVNTRKWYLMKHKRSNYATSLNTIQMHRFIMGVTDKKDFIDHINHNGLDNRRCNLRICNRNQNVQHTRSRVNSKSIYLGVSVLNVSEPFPRIRKSKPRRKYLSNIQFNKKNYYLGAFLTEKEAALAYNKKAIELLGEFASLNIID